MSKVICLVNSIDGLQNNKAYEVINTINSEDETLYEITDDYGITKQFSSNNFFVITKEIEECIFNSQSGCEYCQDNNTEEMLRGYDGIVQEDDNAYIYIEHFRNEKLRIENIKYCTMCGRKLVK